MYVLELVTEDGNIVAEKFNKQVEIVNKYKFSERSIRNSVKSGNFIKSKNVSYKVSELDDNEVGDILNNMPLSEQLEHLSPSYEKEEDYTIGKDNIDKSTLIIGDLHAPFTNKGYLEFCKSMYKKYNIEEVIIIGDIIDNHYSSYHETDPSGYSADDELNKAKSILQGFYKEFPNAKVTIGNHDRIVLRKAFTSGLSKQWIKDMKNVLEVPNWEFKEYYILNNRLYYHGEGMNPKAKAKEEMISCVCGHNHSQSYIEFFQNRQGTRIFSMQIGTGIDQDTYAFAYNKFGRPSHINVGIIYKGVPIIEYMD